MQSSLFCDWAKKVRFFHFCSGTVVALCRVVINSRYVFLGCLAALVTGCIGIYSPPARLMPLETASTLKENQTGLSGEVGYAGAVFGPDVLSVSARVRRLLIKDLDWTAEANLLHIFDRNENPTDADPNVYSIRGGLKYRLVECLSFTGGAGGGASAGGGFFSPDLGVVLAYENDYFFPFFSVRGYLSQPIAAQAVSYGDGDDITAETPKFTFGWSPTAGFRIPLARSSEIGSILLGIQLTHMANTDHSAAFFGIAGGPEFVL
jgi:hypothetical protein